MARTEEPRRRRTEDDIPEQRQQSEEPDDREEPEAPEMPEIRQYGDLKGATDPLPRITVLGHMDHQVALRLGWRQGMVAISQSRFKFLANELGMDILDQPENYLF